MPISGGTAGAHDDAMHQGSAKRDVPNGVAGLEGLGDLIVPNDSMYLARSAIDNIIIRERTSAEMIAYFNRVGVDDFTLFIKESGVWERAQTASMKDVLSGIAALGAGGQLLAPGPDIELTRDGSENIEVVERTSGDIVYRWTRIGANDYECRINCGGVACIMQNDSMKDIAGGIAGLDANVQLDLLQMRAFVEEYYNHHMALDNFIQTETGGNGTAVTDAANHEMDLSSGVTAADGYARLESKKTFALGTAPLVQSYIVNNVQNGVGAGADLILVGFISATGFPGESYSVGFYKDSADAWHCLTNSSGMNSTKTGISAPSNGDLLTIIATSASVKFYENGVLLATHTTNIPTSNNCIGAAVYGDAQTTAVQVSVDMMNMKRYRA